MLYEVITAYKTCIVDEEATGIMTALNGLNGIPCSAHNWARITSYNVCYTKLLRLT